jgi:hypothetical protein
VRRLTWNDTHTRNREQRYSYELVNKPGETSMQCEGCKQWFYECDIADGVVGSAYLTFQVNVRFCCKYCTSRDGDTPGIEEFEIINCKDWIYALKSAMAHLMWTRQKQDFKVEEIKEFVLSNWAVLCKGRYSLQLARDGDPQRNPPIKPWAPAYVFNRNRNKVVEHHKPFWRLKDVRPFANPRAEKMAKLEAELRTLRSKGVAAVQQRATAAGVGADQLAAALGAEKPMAELSRLIVERCVPEAASARLGDATTEAASDGSAGSATVPWDYQDGKGPALQPCVMLKITEWHPGMSLDFKCDYPGCSEAFEKKSQLETHKRKCPHKPKPIPEYKCQYAGCSEAFHRKKHRQDHEKVCPHKPPPPKRECPFPGCPQSFEKQKELDAHKKTCPHKPLPAPRPALQPARPNPPKITTTMGMPITAAVDSTAMGMPMDEIDDMEAILGTWIPGANPAL